MNVLLPTDFSENSKNAIEYALNFFSGENVNFTLLHVFDEPHSSIGVLVSIEEKIRANSRMDLRSFFELLPNKKSESNFLFNLQVKKGSMDRVLKEVIRIENIDVIFMGTQGASGIKEKIIGSVTADVIRNAKCPVIAVPRNSKFVIPERIAFATDLEPVQNYDILDALIEIVKHFNSKLMVVHTFSSDKSIKEPVEIEESNQLRRKLSDVQEQYHYLATDDTEGEIEKFVKDRDIHILAMVTREHGLMSRLFKRSTVEKMSFRTDIPLFAIPDEFDS